MEREITQTLEDTKRNFETEKQKAIQAKVILDSLQCPILHG